jgi:hypothetical protein
MEPTNTGSNQHPKKRNKTGLVLFIIILLAGAGFATWKYLLPMLNGNKSSSGVIMKRPDIVNIKNTQQFGEIPINQFGIVLKDGLTKADAKKIANQVNGTITGEIDIINFYQLETKTSTESDFNKIFTQLQQTTGIELVSPNGLLIINDFDESKGTCDPLDDPMYQDTANGRNYKMIGLKDAYAFIKASGLKLNPVKIGVLDTRLYKPCDELGGGINVSTTEAEDYNDNPQKNDNGAVINGGLTHGTMVNEVLGANAENGGVTGVASPVGDKLTIVTTNIYKKDDYEVSTPDPEDPSKVVSQGVTYVHTTLKAMLDQIKNGATIINCSYGPKNYDEDRSFETKLYEKFYKKIQEKYPKVVIVGSAGNANKPLTSTNGANKGQKVGNFLTVGSLDKDGKKSSYSNYATPDAEVSISAPADDMILGMDKNGNPITASGTSLAAPQVAGTVALIQSLNPDLTAQEIKNILQSTADKVIDGRNMSTPIPNGMGAGMLRVDNAVLKVINDLRVKQGLPILTKETMLGMTIINLTYTGGPEEFKIKASISAISGSSTTLTLDIVGNNYSIGGKPSQTISAPGDVNWSLTMKPDTKVTAKVSRSDTKSCAWVVIEAVEFTGKWKIIGKVTSAKLDASLGTFKDMGEKIYGADRGEMDAGQKEAEQSMIGKEVPLSEIDVESWKYMGCKITKEGSTIVITPPGADNPKALGSMIYYIENITGNTFTGRAIAKNHFGGKDNEIHYTITGTRIE